MSATKAGCKLEKSSREQLTPSAPGFRGQSSVNVWSRLSGSLKPPEAEACQGHRRAKALEAEACQGHRRAKALEAEACQGHRRAKALEAEACQGHRRAKALEAEACQGHRRAKAPEAEACQGHRRTKALEAEAYQGHRPAQQSLACVSWLLAEAACRRHRLKLARQTTTEIQ
jgi:hypothetical protein